MSEPEHYWPGHLGAAARSRRIERKPHVELQVG